MSLARYYADLDLGEFGWHGRYADGDAVGNPFQAMQNWTTNQRAVADNHAQGNGQSGTTQEYGATGAVINDPNVAPNAYQYGGMPGGAQAFNNSLQYANAQQQHQQGAQIDQGQVGGTLGQLSGFYGGQLNGTGPSLAAEQMKAATDQNIAAQMAAANSAHGTLAAAGAQMNAANNASQMEQNAAQQSMQGRIQEEYNAAQGLQGVAGEQGQLAMTQAQLQEQQQLENARMGLGYAGLENTVNEEQLQAQQQAQAQMSGNYLAASGMGMNQSQFNTQQNTNLALGGIGAGIGLLGALGDADFQEPSGLAAHSYADADMPPPAHLTMREERAVDPHPFMVLADRNTGRVERVKTEPLDNRERARVNEPHGAGPLFADGLARAHTTMHDMNAVSVPPPAAMNAVNVPPPAAMNAVESPAASGWMSALQANPGGGAAPSRPAAPPRATAAKPAGPSRFQRAMLGAKEGLSSMYQPVAIQPYQPVMPSAYEAHLAPVADLDLDAEEHQLAHLYGRLGHAFR